jgi:hypothetical protein
LSTRKSLAWQYQLSRYLDELSEWKAEHETSEADYFHQKCTIYTTLAAITPKGLLFDRIVEEYLSFLTQNRHNRDSFIEWHLHLNELLRRKPQIEKEAAETLIEAMRTADDAVIRLLIRLQPYFKAAE